MYEYALPKHTKSQPLRTMTHSKNIIQRKLTLDKSNVNLLSNRELMRSVYGDSLLSNTWNIPMQNSGSNFPSDPKYYSVDTGNDLSIHFNFSFSQFYAGAIDEGILQFNVNVQIDNPHYTARPKSEQDLATENETSQNIAPHSKHWSQASQLDDLIPLSNAFQDTNQNLATYLGKFSDVQIDSDALKSRLTSRINNHLKLKKGDKTYEPNVSVVVSTRR